MASANEPGSTNTAVQTLQNRPDTSTLTIVESKDVTFYVQTQSGNTFTLVMKASGTVEYVKDKINMFYNKEHMIPRDHQILRIAGESLDNDHDKISQWVNQSVTVDMVLERRISDYLICIIDPRYPDHCILDVNSTDTIDILISRIPFDLKVEHFKPSYYLSYRKIPMDEYHTLHDYRVSLFQWLLKLRVSLLGIENHRNVYSVVCNDLQSDTSYHNRDEYLLSVEYNTTVNKLYSMVADHYKISVGFRLKVNNFYIPSSNTALHQVFYSPIFVTKDVSYTGGGEVASLFSKCTDCSSGKCVITAEVKKDPVIKHMVAERSDAWMVLHAVFNLSSDIKKDIEENSEDNHIRCMDVMHRVYHHNCQLTWDLIEAQVRRDDPHLADVILFL